MNNKKNTHFSIYITSRFSISAWIKFFIVDQWQFNEYPTLPSGKYLLSRNTTFASKYNTLIYANTNGENKTAFVYSGLPLRLEASLSSGPSSHYQLEDRRWLDNWRLKDVSSETLLNYLFSRRVGLPTHSLLARFSSGYKIRNTWRLDGVLSDTYVCITVTGAAVELFIGGSTATNYRNSVRKKNTRLLLLLGVYNLYREQKRKVHPAIQVRYNIVRKCI